MNFQNFALIASAMLLHIPRAADDTDTTKGCQSTSAGMKSNTANNILSWQSTTNEEGLLSIPITGPLMTSSIGDALVPAAGLDRKLSLKEIDNLFIDLPLFKRQPKLLFDVFGMVRSFEDAKVVLLADIHTEDAYKKCSYEMVSFLQKKYPGTVFFLEGKQKGQGGRISLTPFNLEGHIMAEGIEGSMQALQRSITADAKFHASITGPITKEMIEHQDAIVKDALSRNDGFAKIINAKLQKEGTKVVLFVGADHIPGLVKLIKSDSIIWTNPKGLKERSSMETLEMHRTTALFKSKSPSDKLKLAKALEKKYGSTGDILAFKFSALYQLKHYDDALVVMQQQIETNPYRSENEMYILFFLYEEKLLNLFEEYLNSTPKEQSKVPIQDVIEKIQNTPDYKTKWERILDFEKDIQTIFEDPDFTI